MDDIDSNRGDRGANFFADLKRPDILEELTADVRNLQPKYVTSTAPGK